MISSHFNKPSYDALEANDEYTFKLLPLHSEPKWARRLKKPAPLHENKRTVAFSRTNFLYQNNPPFRTHRGSILYDIQSDSYSGPVAQDDRGQREAAARDEREGGGGQEEGGRAQGPTQQGDQGGGRRRMSAGEGGRGGYDRLGESG